MIKATYEEIHESASRISQASGDYITSVNDLYERIDGLANSWKGADNLSFVNTVNGYKNDIKTLGDIVNDYAIFLNKSADAINDAQENVANLATKL